VTESDAFILAKLCGKGQYLRVILSSMKDFFSIIKKSVYDPVFYQELIVHPARYSVKYFLGLSLFLSITLTIIVSLPIIPLVSGFMDALPEQVLTTYPDELILHFKKGVLTSNVPEPYFVEIPPFLRGAMKGDQYAHLAVIDTQAMVTPEQFAVYQAPLWLARTNVVIADSNHSLKVQTYGTQTSFVLSEPLVQAFITRLEPYFVWAAPIIVLIIFVSLLAVLLFNFVYLIFGALCVFILGRFILRQKWSYGTAYRIGLHALTLAVLMDVLCTTVGFSLKAVPFLTTLLLLLTVYVNYRPVSRSGEAEERTEVVL